MKVMWLCNTPIPCIAEDAGLRAGVNEGWLQNLSRLLVEQKGVELIIAFPQHMQKNSITGEINKIKYLGFHADVNKPDFIDTSLIPVFEEAIKRFKPSVIHLMGTEFAHSVSMVEAIKNTNKIDSSIVSIQGMPSFLAKHMLNGIPTRVCTRKRIKDILYNTGLKHQQRQMQLRGLNEAKVLRNCKHVFGRTDWDYACTKLLNESIQYHHGGEILRQCFYDSKWNYHLVEQHSIFFSQANSAIKGFHIAIEAFALLAKKYPDIKIYVGGNNGFKNASWKLSSYEKYIITLIECNDLTEKVVFTGPLSSEEMMRRYLSSHVFVSASVIENSPNSVGEAMLLGMPIVTSDVGGVKSMIEHDKEGFIYPSDEPYMLAYYVSKVFDDPNLAVNLGVNARSHAMRTHNKDSIVQEVYEVYQILANKC